MAEQYGILAQSFPAAATITQLYGAPSQSQAVISSIMINNQDAAEDQFWLAFSKGGTASDVPMQYAYGAGPAQTGGGVRAPSGNPVALTLGITLGPSDQIWVMSLNGTTSFNVFGDLISIV